MDKKIEELSEVELKAAWFDMLADIERCQNNIAMIKKEFERRKQAEVKVEEVKSA